MSWNEYLQQKYYDEMKIKELQEEKAEVEKLLLALIREDEEEEAPEMDMKSPEEAVKGRKSTAG